MSTRGNYGIRTTMANSSHIGLVTLNFKIMTSTVLCAAKNVLAYLKDNDIQIMSPEYYVHCYSLILLFRPSPTSLTVKLQHIMVSEPSLFKRPSV